MFNLTKSNPKSVEEVNSDSELRDESSSDQDANDTGVLMPQDISNVSSVMTESTALFDWSIIPNLTDEGLNLRGIVPMDEPVHLSIGIDEAGRGSCMGPMIYGLCAVETKHLLHFKKTTGAMDSKQMDHSKRYESAKQMIEYRANDTLGHVFWSVRTIHAQEIDQFRLCRYPKSLNEVSMDAAFELIELFLNKLKDSNYDFVIDKITFDAIGPPEYLVKRAKYRLVKRPDGVLNRQEQTVIIVAESKADFNYVECGAASIFAKLNRDYFNKTLEFAECVPLNRNWGCGYPSDSLATEWLKANVNHIFGHPRAVRHSWRNAIVASTDRSCQVTWAHEWNQEQRKFTD